MVTSLNQGFPSPSSKPHYDRRQDLGRDRVVTDFDLVGLPAKVAPFLGGVESKPP
jgi:hypothetical protein